MHTPSIVPLSARVRRLAGVLLVALAALAAVPAQQPPPSTGAGCPRCKGHGEEDCSRHRDIDVDAERGVRHCSVAAACRKCGGALTVDCRSCRNEAAEQAAAARREAARAWLDERRARWSEHLDDPDEVEYLATAHADLMFGLERMTVGRRKLDRHELMHLYGARVEALRARFVEVLELGPEDFPEPAEDVDPRLHLHLFAERDDHLAVGPRVTGIGTRGASSKLMGATLAWSMWRDPRLQRGDTDVHRSTVHNVTHLLLSGMRPVGWIGNRGHGWIDEGVAHWFEYFLVDERCANFCYEEVALQPGANYAGGEWRVALRKLAERGALQSFVDLYTKNSDELDLEQHAHVFGFVDFLIRQQDGGRRFADLLRRVKGGAETRDALQAAYGFAPLEFDPRFAEFVRAHYPLRR